MKNNNNNMDTNIIYLKTSKELIKKISHLKKINLLHIYQTLSLYEDKNQNLLNAQTHFDGKLCYILDVNVLVISGDIDNLNDSLSDGFVEFIKSLTKIAINSFKIATVSWGEEGRGVYYVKCDQEFSSCHLVQDDWEETLPFQELLTVNSFDIDSDDFYDDNDEGESPFSIVCGELYNELLSYPELLKPKWF